MVATNGNTAAIDELMKKYKDVDPFLITKWERIFTMFFDKFYLMINSVLALCYRNCSATLESGDFYLVIRKVREVYGVESIQNRYARKTLESLWSGLCKTVGIGRESIISLDEWVQLLRKVNKNEKEPKWLDDYQAFMFKLFDVSGDGVLDQSEYADGMSLYGFKYKECMNNFKQIAFDSNGKEVKHITPAIWKTLFTDLFFSADKNRPGNLLFGKGIYSKGNPVPDKSLEKTNSMDKSNSTDKTQMVKSNSQE